MWIKIIEENGVKVLAITSEETTTKILIDKLDKAIHVVESQTKILGLYIDGKKIK